MKYHALFLSKTKKNVAKFVIFCNHDWRFTGKGLDRFHSAIKHATVCQSFVSISQKQDIQQILLYHAKITLFLDKVIYSRHKRIQAIRQFDSISLFMKAYL